MSDLRGHPAPDQRALCPRNEAKDQKQKRAPHFQEGPFSLEDKRRTAICWFFCRFYLVEVFGKSENLFQKSALFPPHGCFLLFEICLYSDHPVVACLFFLFPRFPPCGCDKHSCLYRTPKQRPCHFFMCPITKNSRDFSPGVFNFFPISNL
ncbi:hypothetical protein Bb109J_c3079 [Bdellovibrio bacteriovorus]|nr:hypothetical protein Bb109J_c3079 [Bdellovibrio bacteriovorus]